MATTESAVYTITLRTLLENEFDIGLNPAVIDDTDPQNPIIVTPADYPIFDELYRETLNKKIKDHFYFHEIGYEVEGRFKFELNAKMREIMPLYNQMYESEKIIQNPMVQFDRNITQTTITEEDTVQGNTQITDQDSTQQRDVADKELKVNSKTPKQMLTKTELDGDIWASEADRMESTTDDDVIGTLDETVTNNGTVARDVTVTYTASENGRQMSEAELLQLYRDTFLNIDMLIIDELEELFMMVL